MLSDNDTSRSFISTAVCWSGSIMFIERNFQQWLDLWQKTTLAKKNDNNHPPCFSDNDTDRSFISIADCWSGSSMFLQRNFQQWLDIWQKPLWQKKPTIIILLVYPIMCKNRARWLGKTCADWPPILLATFWNSFLLLCQQELILASFHVVNFSR